MREAVGRRVRMLGWAIASKLVRTRGKGVFMKFLSCEDLTDTFEATLFPEAYQRLAPRTLGPGPYLLAGKIENDQGAVSIVVDDLVVLEIGF
jgi:DNA polymerase III alpha subunit